MFAKYKKQILEIAPMEQRCVWQYEPWLTYYQENEEMKRIIENIKKRVGKNITRQDIINYFKCENADEISKFILVMIWGHESDELGKRDGRGPWKVAEMTSNLKIEFLKEAITLICQGDTKKAYKLFMWPRSKLPRCGPNFFSKYFYFIGKSRGIQKYPLIFDDRVAAGLLKICQLPSNILGLVSVGAKRKDEAYLEYIRYFMRKQQNCNARQIR